MHDDEGDRGEVRDADTDPGAASAACRRSSADTDPDAGRDRAADSV
jgi:hypothetical protein